MKLSWPSSARSSSLGLLPLLMGLFLAIFQSPTTAQPKKAIPEVVLLFDNGGSPDSELTMRFGLIVTTAKDPRTPSGYKQLTYHPEGITSNTCVKIDTKDYLFGHPPGKWVEREAKLGKDNEGQARLGRKSVALLPQKIQVTQTVEIIRGAITGNMDTCLVHYVIENQDTKEHQVGLRFLLDTYIGSNDGAPFIMAGEESLCDKQRTFTSTQQMPPYIFALEKMTLNDPEVVAQLNLKPLANAEPPSKVTLGGWPDKRSKIPGANDGLTLWNVPVFPIDKMDDSAAVLYWAEKALPAGKQRELAFTYGLGFFTCEEKGKLGLFLSGRPEPKGEIVIVALRRDPQKGEKLSLKKGSGYEIIEGNSEQLLKLPDNNSYQLSPVTWKLRLKETGTVTLRVDSSSGLWHQHELQVGNGSKKK